MAPLLAGWYHLWTGHKSGWDWKLIKGSESVGRSWLTRHLCASHGLIILLLILAEKCENLIKSLVLVFFSFFFFLKTFAKGHRLITILSLFILAYVILVLCLFYRLNGNLFRNYHFPGALRSSLMNNERNIIKTITPTRKWKCDINCQSKVHTDYSQLRWEKKGSQ